MIDQRHKVTLHLADLFELAQRIERNHRLAQFGFDILGYCARRQQSLALSLGWVVALAHTRTDARLGGQLERGLVEVNELS